MLRAGLFWAIFTSGAVVYRFTIGCPLWNHELTSVRWNIWIFIILMLGPTLTIYSWFSGVRFFFLGGAFAKIKKRK
jgi:hypothetical protein